MGGAGRNARKAPSSKRPTLDQMPLMPFSFSSERAKRCRMLCSIYPGSTFFPRNRDHSFPFPPLFPSNSVRAATAAIRYARAHARASRPGEAKEAKSPVRAAALDGKARPALRPPATPHARMASRSPDPSPILRRPRRLAHKRSRRTFLASSTIG